MKYRVIRYFEDDTDDQTLIGHYETKRMADNAIRDDIYARPTRKSDPGLYAAIKYKIDEVEIILTQSEIDEMIKLAKQGSK
jgi:hypothetical protein